MTYSSLLPTPPLPPEIDLQMSPSTLETSLLDTPPPPSPSPLRRSSSRLHRGPRANDASSTKNAQMYNCVHLHCLFHQYLCNKSTFFFKWNLGSPRRNHVGSFFTSEEQKERKKCSWRNVNSCHAWPS